MNPDHAAEGHMTPAELAAWVDETRAAQGLPPRLDHEPTLQRIADLMRAVDHPPDQVAS